MRIDVSGAEALPGWMSREELEWLADTARRCERIVEVGSWKGRSTKALALHTPGVVYAVDHWCGSVDDEPEVKQEIAARGPDGLYAEFASNLDAELRAGKVIPIRAESREAVALVLNALAGRLADLVFLDGDHAFEAVKRDIEDYRPLVRRGGLLAGHDYSLAWIGVVDAVEMLLPHRSLVPGTALWWARMSEVGRS